VRFTIKTAVTALSLVTIEAGSNSTTPRVEFAFEMLALLIAAGAPLRSSVEGLAVARETIDGTESMGRASSGLLP
jgi:hypothetical protein